MGMLKKAMGVGTALAVVLGLCAFGCGDSTPVRVKQSGKIPLSEVPQNVKDAALKRVKGLELREAEKHVDGEKVKYELDGVTKDKEVEIQVMADGKVVFVEFEDRDDSDE